jgi:dipeptidyl aminopeptidase/acylaminoacyl peptidase
MPASAPSPTAAGTETAPPEPTATAQDDPDLQTLLRSVGYRAGMIAYHRYLRFDMDPAPAIDDHIYVRQFDGSNEVDVTEGFAEQVASFSWSPTGDWIVFTSGSSPRYRSDGPWFGVPVGMWSVRADGRDRRFLFVSHDFLRMDWSPDGRLLVGNCLVEGDPLRICIADPESGAVITSPHSGRYPQLSPDGLHYGWYDERRALWVADAASHTSRMILPAGSEWFGGGFSWSRDADSILTAETVLEVENVPCAGSSTFLRIDIASGERESLGTIPLPVTHWEATSSDEGLVLFSAPRCQWNVYTFYGIASLDGTYVNWPISDENFDTFTWAPDGLQLEVYNPLYDRMQIMDPFTGARTDVPPPIWITEILTRETSVEVPVQIEWAAAPGPGPRQ